MRTKLGTNHKHRAGRNEPSGHDQPVACSPKQPFERLLQEWSGRSGRLPADSRPASLGAGNTHTLRQQPVHGNSVAGLNAVQRHRWKLGCPFPGRPRAHRPFATPLQKQIDHRARRIAPSMTDYRRRADGFAGGLLSFVLEMLDDPDNLSIVDGAIGLAKASCRQVLAGRVETIAHGDDALVARLQFGTGNKGRGRSRSRTSTRERLRCRTLRSAGA